MATAAPPPAPTLVLSTTTPGRADTVTAVVTGCDPGTEVTFWHQASLTWVGPEPAVDPELSDISAVACAADGTAAITVDAQPSDWVDPRWIVTGGAVSAHRGDQFGDDTRLGPVGVYEFVAGPGASTPTPAAAEDDADELPATGSTATLAVAGAATLLAGAALVGAARRRRPATAPR